MNILHEFDLTYWQMREALGYPIPDRIDRRWRKKLAGNGGHNPFACGKCEARRRFPGVNLAHDILELHDHLPPDEWADVERRIKLAFREIGGQLESPRPAGGCVMADAEAYNDEHIAPKLRAIADECAANGLAFVARVEWEPFEGQTTAMSLAGGHSASFLMVRLASHANGNLDTMLIALARAHTQGRLDVSQTMLAHWMQLGPFKAESPTPGDTEA